MIIIHDPHCTDYSAPGHPERPERISATTSRLKTRHADWEWRAPLPASEEAILRAHTIQHLNQVRDATSDFDLDTPAYPGIYHHAVRAAGGAIEVATTAIQQGRAFSLMRPPGHHATRTRAMGFCYFNNIGIAALDAIAMGGPNEKPKAQRVAIWDFDAHHGNGTEEIIAANPGIVFASIHQFPGYPSTGTRSFGNVHNFPIPPLTPRDQHIATVRHAFDLLVAFNPDLLLISAGFDAYAKDPITEMTLEAEDFVTFGHWLSEANVPAGAILEGGYSRDLPELVDGFLSGWNG